MKRSARFLTGVVLAVAGLMLAQMPGCGGGGGGTSATGTLQVAITDAQQAAITRVHLTVDRVVAVPAGKEEAQDSDPGLLTIATFPGGKSVEVLNLHFLPQILGDAAIPAGSYNQIRLILAPDTNNSLANFVTVAGSDTQIPLITPSGHESGVKITGRFTVSAGVINTVLLDFNPASAIVVQGNGSILFKPQGIRLIQVFNSLTNAGAVTGNIHSPLFAPWSTATVTAVPRTPAASAVTNGTVFSNFSGVGVWNGPFTVFLPPNGSTAVPSAQYKLFVQAYRDIGRTLPVFGLYSSPLFSISTGVDTTVPPNGIVQLGP